MNVVRCHDRIALGQNVARDGAALLRRQLRQHRSASLVLATGTSQLEVLSALVGEPDIDWSRVVCFHLDEYVGMPSAHPASFCRFLRERFLEKLSEPRPVFHFLDGMADPAHECRRAGNILAAHEIDVAFIGIGENGHLAFNDPPADFHAEAPYLVVNLDENCRRQQVGEGWFTAFDETPRTAISMSIRQILKARNILCAVPDARKARAVHDALTGEISPLRPASILRTHPQCSLYLDPPAASLLAPP